MEVKYRTKDLEFSFKNNGIEKMLATLIEEVVRLNKKIDSLQAANNITVTNSFNNGSVGGNVVIGNNSDNNGNIVVGNGNIGNGAKDSTFFVVNDSNNVKIGDVEIKR